MLFARGCFSSAEKDCALSLAASFDLFGSVILDFWKRDEARASSRGLDTVNFLTGMVRLV